MTGRARLHRGLRIVGASALLAAICACGGLRDDNDTPPPPTPAPSNAGAIAQFDVGPGFMPDPRLTTGTAGGPIEASTLSIGCTGNIGSTPNHLLNLTGSFTDLRLVVSSSHDTTLIVQLADGSYRCDDDGGQGLNPMVSGPFPSGLHRVFVGTYSSLPQGSSAEYTLAVTANPNVTAASIGGGPAEAVAPSGPLPPPPGLRPGAASTRLVSLPAGFAPDPHTAQGTAGGPLDANMLHQGCVGSLPLLPQHTLMLGTTFASLNVMVNSRTDTTLVIRAPDGTYRCDDDSGGEFRPRVRGSWPPGAYQIWVGVYEAGQSERYTIGFSQFESVTAASLPLP